MTRHIELLYCWLALNPLPNIYPIEYIAAISFRGNTNDAEYDRALYLAKRYKI